LIPAWVAPRVTVTGVGVPDVGWLSSGQPSHPDDGTNVLTDAILNKTLR